MALDTTATHPPLPAVPLASARTSKMEEINEQIIKKNKRYEDKERISPAHNLR
jgi:hypothetical protein